MRESCQKVGDVVGYIAGKESSDMAKKQQRSSQRASSESSDKPSTLKDLLRADTLAQLKEKANTLKAEEDKRKEEQRRQAEEARKAEQKRLDNDFGHLLENSKLDWRKYK
jgi:hypothetical protein